MMVGVLVRRYAPFAPAQWAKEWMSWSCTVAKSLSDSFQHLQQRRAFVFKRRRRSLDLQRGRSWRSLGEGKHVQNQVLEWERLKRALVSRRHGILASVHLRRKTEMFQHAGYVHAAPARG